MRLLCWKLFYSCPTDHRDSSWYPTELVVSVLVNYSHLNACRNRLSVPLHIFESFHWKYQASFIKWRTKIIHKGSILNAQLFSCFRTVTSNEAYKKVVIWLHYAFTNTNFLLSAHITHSTHSVHVKWVWWFIFAIKDKCGSKREANANKHAIWFHYKLDHDLLMEMCRYLPYYLQNG